MACERTSVTIGGYQITFVSRTIIDNTTQFCYDVVGTPDAEHDLNNFVVEICPNNPNQFINFVNIVNCTKQINGGPVSYANCEKVTKPNPSGNQVNLIGIKFDESVATDETARFCFTLNAILDEDCVNVGLKAGTDVFQTTPSQTINGPVCEQVSPLPPGIKTVPFCCYVSVPEGFEPVISEEQPVITSAIVSNCTFLCEGTEIGTGTVIVDTTEITCDFEMPKTDLLGCVCVQNALEITDGEQVSWVCCNDSVCIEETLCVSCPDTSVLPTDVQITVDPESLDATFVDSCAGKSAFKITGLIVITFTCPD